MDPDMPADSTRLSVIEAELLEARTREQQTQMTLQAILQRLETLSLSNSPSSTNSTPLSTSEPSPTPKTRSQLKASPPNEFSGDRSTGLAFLNSCRLYLSLCSDQFADEQAKIHWALSYMKEGRAAQFSDRVLRKEASDGFPAFNTWADFEHEFTTQFLPPHHNVDAANRLESTSFYQGKRSVEEYLDEFRYLIDEAGYAEGLGIVMKFRRGLNPSLQNQIAVLGQGRPADNDPEAWFAAARLYEQSRASNAAFIHSHPNPASRPANPVRPSAPPAPRTFSSLPMPLAPRPLYAAGGTPAAASNRPVPMDVDAVRKRNATTLSCYRCAGLGHLAKDCPQRFDVRYMTSEERDDWAQHLLIAKDVAEVEKRADESPEEAQVEDFGVDNE